MSFSIRISGCLVSEIRCTDLSGRQGCNVVLWLCCKANEDSQIHFSLKRTWVYLMIREKCRGKPCDRMHACRLLKCSLSGSRSRTGCFLPAYTRHTVKRQQSRSMVIIANHEYSRVTDAAIWHSAKDDNTGVYAIGSTEVATPLLKN